MRGENHLPFKEKKRAPGKSIRKKNRRGQKRTPPLHWGKGSSREMGKETASEKKERKHYKPGKKPTLPGEKDNRSLSGIKKSRAHRGEKTQSWRFSPQKEGKANNKRRGKGRPLVRLRKNVIPPFATPVREGKKNTYEKIFRERTNELKKERRGKKPRSPEKKETACTKRERLSARQAAGRGGHPPFETPFGRKEYFFILELGVKVLL